MATIIQPKPDIDHEELLEELRAMSWDNIMAIPITGGFSGLFETFNEMGRFISKESSDNWPLNNKNSD